MTTNKTEGVRSSYIIFFPLLFLILILEIVHLPAEIASYRPDFVALMLIFFAISDPLRINVGVAWITGLLLDLLTGAPLGINALVMSFQVFVVVWYFKHFTQYSILQQTFIIGLVNLVAHAMVYWFEHVFGQTGTAISIYVYQTVATLVFWPIVQFIFRVLWMMFNVQAASLKKEREF